MTKKKKLVKWDKTSRGFKIGEFSDRYDAKCTIQESSLATEAAIWLGIHDPPVQKLEYGKGWVDVPLPEGTLVSGRMHLTQEQVAELIPVLQKFAKTGRL